MTKLFRVHGILLLALGATPGLALAQTSAAPAPVQAALSPWGMFLNADIVVKLVIAILAFAVLLTWTIWLAKTLELALAQRRLQPALGHLRAARSLADAASGLTEKQKIAHALLDAAAEEWRQSQDALDDRDGLKERIALHLERVEAAVGRRMIVGTGILATIGATAPFVGLFGTVWGIMNS
ncbi:MAG TPA: MotA/TolQ/ExbB proton channel family protein, partial [Acidocella sp.]|nr:MotA/TolQ/ExbB proton channel family protein [Acidocella sp.]